MKYHDGLSVMLRQAEHRIARRAASRALKQEKRQMDLKDVLTPLVTLAGVWLAARFTLRNEVQKKALEIRTARLESIAADCSDSLTGIRNYVGSSLHLIHKVLYYRQIKKLSIRETADATGYSTSQVCRIQALYKENESS